MVVIAYNFHYMVNKYPNSNGGIYTFVKNTFDGDRLIKDACALICRVFQHPPVYRVGGDEFVVVLEGNDYQNRVAFPHRRPADVRTKTRAQRIRAENHAKSHHFRLHDGFFCGLFRGVDELLNLGVHGGVLAFGPLDYGSEANGDIGAGFAFEVIAFS